jgi:GNAT superfamily N-acetyltransferase
LAEPNWEDAPGVEVIKLEPLETEGMSWLAADGLGLPDFSSFLFCDLPELPGWHCYSAWLEGSEVGCGSMRIVNGIAVFGLDATAPEARQRGCHRALLRRRLEDAKAAGCHTAVASVFDLPAGESAAGLSLQKAGFVQVYRSVGWQQPLHSSPVDSYAAWLY